MVPRPAELMKWRGSPAECSVHPHLVLTNAGDVVCVRTGQSANTLEDVFGRAESRRWASRSRAGNPCG